MKFGHEYEQALASEGFPEQWLGSAIDYKYLKKCIKKVHRELEGLGLDKETIHRLSEPLSQPENARRPSIGQHDFYSAEKPHLDSIPEEFTPQLRVLVDSATGVPLDAMLAPATRARLQKLAQSELIAARRQAHLGHHATHEIHEPATMELTKERTNSLTPDAQDAKWITIPLASAKAFFDLLGPKLEELERLREAETGKLELEIADLGAAVENVVEPVKDGFEAKRQVSYRDLYYWREMFRLYLENPIFYSNLEQNAGALTFSEAKSRLEAYDQQLRSTGLLAKMKTPAAKQAAKQFLDLNVDILKIIRFQEMNARAMSKILKKFDKRTHLEGHQFLMDLRTKYPALLPSQPVPGQKPTGGTVGFANSIARDLHAEITSKVLGIVPQIDDWTCPVCYSMAWRPVSLGCCRSLYCIRCIIKLQDDGHARCPTCNADTVTKADGRNIDFEAMDFLEKYFPLETKRRQKENEKADLARSYGEEFVKPGCEVM
ncbi:hypothetical protein LTR36_007495 [Oleoguttula mirabilis]|uniref:SPX domain-containing protein n=1 Tax=Oleoguttula mirabilis TaxID=1507867 RepID=A0AAV9JU35_9PEZI|nr:hypothetical protein LTR36_007495 [Oleoguttula mirabilis]